MLLLITHYTQNTHSRPLTLLYPVRHSSRSTPEIMVWVPIPSNLFPRVWSGQIMSCDPSLILCHRPVGTHRCPTTSLITSSFIHRTRPLGLSSTPAHCLWRLVVRFGEVSTFVHRTRSRPRPPTHIITASTVPSGLKHYTVDSGQHHSR